MVTQSRRGFYEADLAYIHDTGFADLARSAAATLVQRLRKRRTKAGLVVDLGCGSGIFAARMTHAGFDVLGIDISESMLQLARKHAPQAEFKRCSLFQARLPKCIAVAAIGEPINYFTDHDPTSQVTRLFRRVHKALLPQGVFLLDFAAPRRVAGSEMRHTESRNWAVLVSKEEDPKRRILTRRMTIFRKAGKLFRRSEEVHRQKLYSKAEIQKQLRMTGFHVEQLKAYGKTNFAAGHIGLMAFKK